MVGFGGWWRWVGLDLGWVAGIIEIKAKSDRALTVAWLSLAKKNNK